MLGLKLMCADRHLWKNNCRTFLTESSRQSWCFYQWRATAPRR